MERQNKKWDVLLGMLMLIGCHLLMAIVLWISFFLIPPIAALATYAIGLTQLIYVLPLRSWLRQRGRSKLANGVVICAVITFLINAICFAAFLYFLASADI